MNEKRGIRFSVFEDLYCEQFVVAADTADAGCVVQVRDCWRLYGYEVWDNWLNQRLVPNYMLHLCSSRKASIGQHGDVPDENSFRIDFSDGIEKSHLDLVEKILFHSLFCRHFT